MAKGRMINKRIAKSDKLAALTKDRHRVVYFMLYPHLDREGRFSADPRDIKEDCCPRLPYTISQISESIEALNDIGLIVVYSVGGVNYLEASRFDDFQIGLHKERESPSDIPPNPGPTPQNSTERRSDAENIPLNLKFKLKVKEKVKGDPAVAQIVEYLNLRTGKNFRPGSESTARHIQARLAEGRTLEDFKHVIDVKAAKWLGDPKMDDFLRPETLFAASNFESYLNERIIQPKAPAHLRIGAGSEQRPMTKEQQAERDRLVQEISDSLDKEFGSQIEAARKAGDLAKVKQLSAEQGRAFEDRAAPVFYKYSNAGARP